MSTLIKRALRARGAEGDLQVQVITNAADGVLRHYLQPLMGLFQELEQEMSEFHRQTFGEEGESFQHTEADLFAMLEDGGDLVIAYDLGGLVGFAQMRYEETGKVRSCVLEYLKVAQDSQKAGVGTKLMQQVLAIAEEEKCDHLNVGVYAHNEPARKLYEKFGCVPYSLSLTRRIK